MDAPRFSKIELTGTLTTRYLRSIILLDDGTHWRAVGLPWGAWKYMGERVRAEGMVVGRNKVDVVMLEG
jgi:hypothetical protein